MYWKCVAGERFVGYARTTVLAGSGYGIGNTRYSVDSMLPVAF